MNEIILTLKKLDLSVYKHASNIIGKYNDWNKLKETQKKAFPLILEKYNIYITEQSNIVGYSDSDIEKRVKLLNDYYDFIKNNNYDNVFTSQGKFRPTILEEFMYILFKDLINDKISNINVSENSLKIGSSRAYTNLYFSGTNFEEFIKSPQIGINQKDQDFAIYRPVDIFIGESNSISTDLPIIAIENKTYIDKTMLEGSIATAEKIKNGNPYSLFFIVTENYEVSLNVDPIYSKIDQIYVLRKSKRKDVPHPIYTDVVIDLISEVKCHLERNWQDISNKLRNTGKII